MKTKKSKVLLALIFMAAAASPASAYVENVKIEYTLSGNVYSYKVINLSLSESITIFDIYFPMVTTPNFSDYNSIVASAVPASWTGTAFQPSAINLGGYVDFSGPGIAVGSSLSGFGASFNYTGSGSPGSQYFEVYNANWEVIASGNTVLGAGGGGGGVPDQGGWLCYLFAALPIAGLRLRELRRNRKATS